MSDILDKASLAVKVLFGNFTPEQIAELKSELGKLDAAPTPAAATPKPYSITVPGGVPIFTDISDDGIEGIDPNDKVFTDSTLTTPYPDGTYTLEDGTIVIVAGGVVTTVTPVATVPNPADVPMSVIVKQMETKFSAYKSEVETKHSIQNKALKAEIETLKGSVKFALTTIDQMLKATVNTVDFTKAREVVRFDKKLSLEEYNKLSNVEKEKHNAIHGRP